MMGSCRRRRLMRWTVPRKRNCSHLIRHGFAVPPSPHRGRLGGCAQSLAPLPGADSPYQGEMSRRDKRGRDAGSAQPRLRGRRRFAIKPKPQIQFAVWKGRNGLRGKEAPRTAGTRSVEAGSDAPPAAISFPSRGKRYGRKGRLRMHLVLPASAFRQDPMFRASFHSRLTLRVSAARRLIRGYRVCSSLH